MITCEFIGGPFDGGTVELPNDTPYGYLHGVLMAHYASHHPFVALAETPLVATPEVVVFYKLALCRRLEFQGYKQHA